MSEVDFQQLFSIFSVIGLSWMSGVIPQADDRLVAVLVLKAEDTNRGRRQKKNRPALGAVPASERRSSG